MKDLSTTEFANLPSKVEVTSNSKGYTWTIGCRCEDGQEDNLIERIKQLNEKMKASFKSDKE